MRIGARLAEGIVTPGVENERTETSLPAFGAVMALADEIRADEGRAPSTLRRCSFARVGGRADLRRGGGGDRHHRPLRRGRATDFTCSLHHPTDAVLADFVAGHRAGSRAQFEQLAAEVLPRF